jgi:hypothetical protein
MRILFLLAVLSTGACECLDHALGGACKDSPCAEIVSSTGRRAFVVVRDCGATTPYVDEVQGEESQSARTDLVAVRDSQCSTSIAWSADGRTLNVRVHKTPEDVFQHVREWHDIRVNVEAADGGL